MRRPLAILAQLTGAIRHPLATEVVTLSGAQTVSALLGSVTAVIAARFLGPQGYGIVATTIALPLLASAITSVKTLPLTTRYIGVFRKDQNKQGIAAICKVGCAIDALGAAVALGITWTMAHLAPNSFMSSPRPYLSVTYAAALLVYSVTGTGWAVLSTYRRFQALAACVVIEKVVVLVIVVTSLLRGGGVAAVVIGIAIGHGVGALLVTGIANQTLRRDQIPSVVRTRAYVLHDVRAELKSFLGWGYLITTASGVITNLPVLILSAARGPREAGFYRLALTLTAPATIVEGSLWRVVYPTMVSRWTMGERESLRHSIRKWAVLGGGPLGLAVLVSVMAVPFAVRSLFGTSYEPMILGSQFMLCGAAVSLAFFYISPLFYVSDRVGLMAKIFTLYSLLFLCATAVLAPAFGFTGVSVAYFFGVAVFNVLMALIARRLWRST